MRITEHTVAQMVSDNILSRAAAIAAIAAERIREQDANDTEWAGAEARMRARIAFPEAGQFGSVEHERVA